MSRVVARAGAALDLATTTAMNATAAAAAASSAAVAEIAANRADIDVQSPKWLILALLAVLLFVIMLDTPRILARIRSTYPRLFSSHKNPTAPIPSGGELFQGLMLKWRDGGKPTLLESSEMPDIPAIKVPHPTSFAIAQTMSMASISEDYEEKPCAINFNCIPPTPVLPSLSDSKDGFTESEKLGWGGGEQRRESDSSSIDEKDWKDGRTSRQSSVASMSSVTSETPILAYNREVPSPSQSRMGQKTPTPSSQLGPPPFTPNLLSLLPFSPLVLLVTPLPRHLPNLTISHILLLSTYFILVMLSLLYRADYSFSTVSNPAGPDILRVGWLALAQVPVVVCLGGRNSVVRFMLGGGENVLVQKVHKLVARLMFVCILLHAALYWHKWVLSGRFYSSSSVHYIIAGYISTGFLTLIVITSLPVFRNRFYGAFTVCHFIGLFGFLIALAYHVRAAIPFVTGACVLYGLDLIVRAVKTKHGMAHLSALKGAETTVVSVSGLGEGWRAGQYVIVRVPALAKTTGLHALEGHPFSIASAPGTDGLVLMVKNTGNWTKALFDLATNTAVEPESGTTGPNVKILIEGPYGGTGHTLFASYSSVLIVAGGSGLSFALSMAHDLVLKASRDQTVRAKTINLVWVVRTQDIARPMIKYLHALVEDARAAERKNGDAAPILKVDIFLTRSPAFSPVDILSRSTSLLGVGLGGLSPGGLFPPDRIPSAAPSIAPGTSSGIEVTSRRPMLRDLVESAVDVGEKNGGVGVAVCGPEALCKDIRGAVRQVKEWRRLRVGGIELHEEFFGF